MADAAEAGRPHRARMVLLPLALLVGVTLTVYGLARWNPFDKSPPPPAAGTVVVSGDAARGATAFATQCAGCHGAGGVGGGVGPELAGSAVTLAEARAVIAAGRGVMPAGLVTGAQEQDVLAYLATILAGGGRGGAP